MEQTTGSMKDTSFNLKTLLLGIFLMLSVFIFEIYTGILVGTTSYILCVLFILWFSKTDKLLITLGIFSSILIAAGYFYTYEIVSSQYSIMLNRTLTLIGVWFSVYFALRFYRISRKEKKLKDQLSTLFKNAGEGIVILDQYGKVILANPAVSGIFGYDSAELVKRSFYDFLPIDMNPGLTQVFDPAVNFRQVECTGLTRKGKSLPLEVTTTHHESENNSAIIVFLQDITIKKERERLVEKSLADTRKYNLQLEEQVRLRTWELEDALTNLKTVNKNLTEEIDVRRKVEKELRKSQNLYSAMAKYFPEGVIGVLNSNMRYVFADGEELSILGYEDGKATGQVLFRDINNENVAECVSRIKQVYNGEKVKFDFNLNSGTYSITSVPLSTDSGQVNEALVVIKNISHRKKVENDLLQTIEKERELNMLKSRFVTTASHEFRTPLTTILSSASLLEMYKGDQLEVKKEVHIKRIKKAVNGLTELLNDFLSLGKLEEGNIRAVYSLINFKKLSEEITSQMDPIRKEGQKLITEFQGDKEMISCDKQILKNILLNLLSNAIKYSPPMAEIGWKTVVTGDKVRIEIKDCGIGIPAREQGHIFERFFRAQNAGDYEGTGLGLNITKKYVSLLNGTITFNSVENQGTTFILEIPTHGPILN